ncbi:MAG: signal recognition particle-docking protein FtsY, partial [Caenispirillum bisanense]|nr:signal recognition particle-docking protein FtsY [Caenispirillum bisanense]
MTDETKRPEGSDGDNDKPKKRGFFSRLFGRGGDEAETPASGEEATAPEVRPDARAPVPHDQPAE